MGSVFNEDQGREVVEGVVMVLFVYNQEKYVRESLLSAFNQSMLPSKYIVLDDASSDGTQKEIERLLKESSGKRNVAYLRNDNNQGLIAQLNKLKGMFNDKLMIFQAGDDISYPDRVEKTYKHWLAEGKPSLVLAGYDEIDETGRLSKQFKDSEPETFTLDKLIARRISIYGCCPAYHSEVFNHFHKIPSDIGSDDRVNTFRAFCFGRLSYMPIPLLKYRVGVGISAFQQKSSRDRLHMVVTKAQREVRDINCHIDDLQLSHNVDRERALVLLNRRLTFMRWQSSLCGPLRLKQVVRAAFNGFPITRVWKLYRYLRR